jgi:hypothetical protein
MFRPLRHTAVLAAAAALAAACTDAGRATGPDAPGDGPANGSVPAELVGAWRYGSISPTNFWNDHTGTFSGNAYGMSDHYVFQRNGTFKEYTYIYTQSYGCRTQVWVEMSGAVRFDDETFTTQVSGGRFKVSDSCASSRNYDRAMTASEREERSKTRAYAVRADGSGAAYLQILDGRYDRAE